MSALGNNSLAFWLDIGARDHTQGTLNGMIRSVRRAASIVSKPITIPLRMGRSALALARDINLGLAPLVSGLDRIIERGTSLEVVRKSFESLTGTSGKDASRMARSLVQASSGTLRLAEAMQIANRALASGMQFEQIGTSIEFISKKAITTGKDASQAIDTVITGLSRGSTLFLDDFGILVDGLEGVKQTYDSINGSGAWDALGPAAQKAETVRQAIVEMREQTDKLGISGKETVFVWQSIKNAIGDASDKLFATIGRSDALRGVLTGIRDTIGGMTRHFEQGGSLTELLLGKKGGASGGLLGLLGAGLLDAGELLGRGILGGLLKGLSKLPDLFGWVWGKLKEGWAWAMQELPKAIKAGLEWLKDEFLPALKTTLEPLLQIRIDIIDWLANWLHSFMVDPQGNPTTLGDMVARPGDHKKAWFMTVTGTGGFAGYLLSKIKQAIVPAIQPPPPPPPPPPPTTSPQTPAGPIAFAPGAPGVNAAMHGLLGSAIAMAQQAKTLWQLFGESGDSLLSGGVLGGRSRVRDWYGRFTGEFPPVGAGDRDDVPRFVDPTNFAWNVHERRRRRLELERLNRRIAQSEHVNLTGEAHDETYREIERLRRSGRVLRRGDRQRIFEEIHAELKARHEKEREQLIRERDARTSELNEWQERRKTIDAANEPRPASGEESASAIGRMEQHMAEIKDAVMGFARASGLLEGKLHTA